MKNTKGVSAVVTTVILLAIALIAVGIVWVVIQGILKDSGETAIATASCIEANIEIVSANHEGSILTVKVKNKGSKRILGVRVISETLKNDTGIVNLDALNTGTATLSFTNKPAEVTVAPYFGSTENPVLCQDERTKKVTGTT